MYSLCLWKMWPSSINIRNPFKLLESCGDSVGALTIKMILSYYGSYQQYKIIKAWIRRRQVDNIYFPIGTYNAYENSFHILISFVLLHEDIPLSTGILLDGMRKKGVTKYFSL